jgi:hypothetical protein
MERVVAVFADHTRRQAGCTADNDWCDAQELTLSTGCAAIGGAPIGGPGWPLAALAMLALGRAAVRRARKWRRLAALTLASALLTPSVAGAQDRQDEQSEAGEAAGGDPGDQSDQGDQGQGDQGDQGDQGNPEQSAREHRAERSEGAALAREERVIEHLPDPVSETWGVALNIGAAVDRGAGSVSLGARWNPWRDLGFGLDAEYNPWVSVSGFEVAPGAASLYVPVIWRLKRFGTWELRSTAYAGASMILFDLVGVDRGTVGLFGGINPLGLALPLGGHAKLVIKPGDVAISAPQLRGIPYYYLQYRFTIGVEWYP